MTEADAGLRVTSRTEVVVKQYIEDLTLALEKIETDALANLVEILVEALNAGSQIYIAGNGGSSTAAIHMASDITSASVSLARPPVVRALTENIARLTAIANDHSYDEIFSRQIMTCGKRGDVLLLLSVSGQSSNLVSAARTGRDLGMIVLAVVGNLGSLAKDADYTVVVGHGDYGLTEDLHVALGHLVVRALRGGRACRYEDMLDGDSASDDLFE